MATGSTLSVRPPRPHLVRAIEAPRRLVSCRPDGEIIQEIQRGDELRALGDFENAWTSYTLALRIWLRLQFLAVSGREDGTGDVYALAQKLRSSLAIDTWTYDALKLILRRPAPVSWLTVDIAAGLIKGLCRVDS
ncbi:MAG: hypothetical protein IT424_07040 [Pirellulales bacterium]|nr:hypothetical protein [Pirellulales bacterium]